MNIRCKSCPGSFGDKEVLLHYFDEDTRADAPLFLLLHGVHGCASSVEGNKYGYLARLIAQKRFPVCAAESSRLRRDRETFGDDRPAWAVASFQGKTFAMEVFDASSALAAAAAEYPGRKIVLWGFSLGGLLSVLLAGGESGRFIRQTGLEPITLPGVDALVISGSGDRIRAEASAGLALPILNSLGSSEVIHTAASKVSLSFALFFYGGCDGTFDEESSRRILRSLRLDEEKKEFHILPGVDHAFRTVNGTPSFEPLEQMLGITMATLERRRRT